MSLRLKTACLTLLLALPLVHQGEGAVAPSFEVDISAYKQLKPYTQPGVVTLKGERWIGNDNLYGLSNNVHVVVEMIKPQGQDLSISSADLRTTVEAKLQKAGLNTDSSVTKAEDFLPYLHVLLVVYPITGGYATSCDIRLFESISLDRIELEGGAVWQGITWEKQTMILSTDDNIAEVLTATVDNILTQFLRRYAFYQKLKKYIK